METPIEKDMNSIKETIFTLQQEIEEINRRLDHIEGHHETLITTSEEIRSVLQLDPKVRSGTRKMP
jgi:prefoldin subunit 5